jgi:hypothetical protein
MDTATQTDHDLLIELRTEMRGMRIDIKNIADGTSLKMADHETRIRTLEAEAITYSTDRVSATVYTRIGGTILIFMVGVAEFFIQKYL